MDIRKARKNSKGMGLSQRGFTLMEIMLVVIIIGILATMVVANLGGMSTEARITRTKADIATIRMGLGLFEQKYGHYPTDAEGGLQALIEKPTTIKDENWKRLIDTELIDPWGNPYVYRVGNSKTDATRDFNLYSFGPNGTDETMEGDDVK
jgi:general secretion pathway protein G